MHILQAFWLVLPSRVRVKTFNKADARSLKDIKVSHIEAQMMHVHLDIADEGH